MQNYNTEKLLNKNIERVSKKFANNKKKNKNLNKNLERIKRTLPKTKRKNNLGLKRVFQGPHIEITKHLSNNNFEKFRKSSAFYKKKLNENINERKQLRQLRLKEEEQRRIEKINFLYAQKLFSKIDEYGNGIVTVRKIKDFLKHLYNLSFDGTIFDEGKNNNDEIDQEVFVNLFLNWSDKYLH